MANMGYNYKKLDTPDKELELHDVSQEQTLPTIEEDEAREEKSPLRNFLEDYPRTTTRSTLIMMGLLILLATIGVASAGFLNRRSTSTASSTSIDVPQYFQTTPELYAGTIVFHHL